MRTVAIWLILREAAATELRIFNGAGDIAIGIDKIYGASNADRTTLRIDEDFDVLTHHITP